MKKNRSSNLRRAWPSSELTERPLEHNLSRSEKDICVQKQHLPPPPPPHFSPSPPSYRVPGESDTPTSTSSTFYTQRCSELAMTQFDVEAKGTAQCGQYFYVFKQQMLIHKKQKYFELCHQYFVVLQAPLHTHLACFKIHLTVFDCYNFPT